MNPILEKIIFTVIGVVIPALIGWLGSQIVKYKKMIKGVEDNNLKKVIVDTFSEELEPVKTVIEELRDDVSKLQTSESHFTTRLTPMQEEIEHLKDDITEILNNLKEQGIELQNIHEKEELLAHETRCAWRYRIRQLCHAYLARGYMSFDEYSQLQEMYNIYSAIGGNGQTKELYEKTMNTVEIKTEVEIQAIKAMAEEK